MMGSRDAVKAMLIILIPTGFLTSALNVYIPTADVKELSRLAIDNKEFGASIKDVQAANMIYTKGKNSCAKARSQHIGACEARTLQSLNNERPGDVYYEAFKSFFVSNKSYDELILLSLDDDGRMNKTEPAFRQQISKKGVMGLVMMAMHGHLERAITFMENGKVEEASQAWDDSWALCYGIDGGSAPFTVVGKRDGSYEGDIWQPILPQLYEQGWYYIQARKAQMGTVTNSTATGKLKEAAAGIYRIMLITGLRNAIRYSWKVQESLMNGKYSAKYHGEAYAYWRTVAGYVASLNKTVANVIENGVMWSKTTQTLSPTVHCEVLKAIYDSLATFEVDCKMIGTLKAKGYDPVTLCGLTCSSPIVAKLPSGMVIDRTTESKVDSDFAKKAKESTCEYGEEFNLVLGKCQKCPKGTYNQQSGEMCKGCVGGFFANTEGSSECQSCSLGKFSPGTVFAQNVECKECEPGTVTQAWGSAECIDCRPGFFQEKFGESQCELCSIGKFSDTPKQRTCAKCPGDTTSEFRGTDAFEKCMCPAGFLPRQQNSSTCTVCPSGIRCEGFGKVPEAAQGFMTLPADALRAYKCIMPEDCPGGPPGTCARGLSDVACGMCAKDHYMKDDQCTECKSSFMWLTVLFYIVVVFCVFIAYYLMHGAHAKTFTLFCITCALGMLVITMQVHAVFYTLKLDFPREFRDILKAFSVVILDFSVLNADCMTESVVVKYFLQVAFFISIVIAAPLLLAVSQVLPTTWRWEKAKTLNLIGQDHGIMLVFAVPLMVAASSFYALCVFVLYKAPSWSMHPTNAHFFNSSIKFLHGRFRVDAWYWGPLLLMRAFLVSLIPTLVPDDAHAQLILFVTFFTVFLAGHVYKWPWKLPILNLVEGVVLTCYSASIVTAAHEKDYTLPLQLMLFVFTYGSLLIVLCIGVTMHVSKKLGIKAEDDTVFSLGKPPDVLRICKGLQAMGAASSSRELSDLQERISKLSIYDRRTMAVCIQISKERGLMKLEGEELPWGSSGSMTSEICRKFSTNTL